MQPLPAFTRTGLEVTLSISKHFPRSAIREHIPPLAPGRTRRPPPLPVYRRMQAARWLIVHQGADLGDFHFDGDGRLVGLGSVGMDATELLEDGEAFCTAGCAGCNRPFYNERPAGPMYNYPRQLEPGETLQAITEMELSVLSFPLPGS